MSSRKKKCQDPPPQIHTIKSLHEHLQWAIEVEHFTIPPYLCALWSIEEGSNPEAAEVIQSVVMEEMLHMTLVANLMNAVGIQPIIDHPKFIPHYAEKMPHSGDSFDVALEKFSPHAIETFMKIEEPKKPGAPPEAHKFHTIAQLYDAVLLGLEYLVCEKGEKAIFTGKKKYQVTPQYYYGGGGFVYGIHNLEDAKKAVLEIAEQGEGKVPKNGKVDIFDGDEKFGQPPEAAHFYRFQEIKLGQKYQLGDKPYHKGKPKTGPTGSKFEVDWSKVHKMQKNPKVSKHKNHPAIQKKMLAFNKEYTDLLRKLEKAFKGQPHLIQEAVGKMYNLKYQGIELMRIPIKEGSKTTVGPSFEYFSG